MVTIHLASAKSFGERAGAVLMMGMYEEAAAKRVHISECEEGLWINLSWNLIQTRDFSHPKLEECGNLPVPIHRSDQEWCSTNDVGPVGVDIASCEQLRDYFLFPTRRSPPEECSTIVVWLVRVDVVTSEQ